MQGAVANSLVGCNVFAAKNLQGSFNNFQSKTAKQNMLLMFLVFLEHNTLCFLTQRRMYMFRRQYNVAVSSCFSISLKYDLFKGPQEHYCSLKICLAALRLMYVIVFPASYFNCVLFQFPENVFSFANTLFLYLFTIFEAFIRNHEATFSCQLIILIQLRYSKVLKILS